MEALSVKKIRILKIIFQPEIKRSQIPGFRGAVIEKAGKDSILFHNHYDEGYRYRYPLIQYKRIGRRASIICINEGVDEIHKFFEHQDWKIKIYDNEYDLKLHSLNVNQFNMQVWDKYFYYHINYWLALNEKNEKQYNELDSLADKIIMLEKILTANILSFAKGIDWHIEDKKVEVKITSINKQGLTRYKKIPRPFFNVDFKTNVFLPNYIGLGKSVSHGFGIVSQRFEKK